MTRFSSQVLKADAQQTPEPLLACLAFWFADVKIMKNIIEYTFR